MQEACYIYNIEDALNNTKKGLEGNVNIQKREKSETVILLNGKEKERLSEEKKDKKIRRV